MPGQLGQSSLIGVETDKEVLLRAEDLTQLAPRPAVSRGIGGCSSTIRNDDRSRSTTLAVSISLP